MHDQSARDQAVELHSLLLIHSVQLDGFLELHSLTALHSMLHSML